MPNKIKESKRKEEGLVIETLRNALFRVQLKKDNREILAYLAGKLRLYRIKILPGDRVLVELSSYDPNKGRIVYRL
ncbi:translation initiation factor IF-1 [bacterium]|nr:translation initiation factor IF-1 [bacterium]